MPPSEGVQYPRDIVPPSEGEFSCHALQNVRIHVSLPF